MNPQPLHRLKEFKITPSVVIPTSISRNLFTFMTLLYCRFLLHGLGTGKGGIPEAALIGITMWKASSSSSQPFFWAVLPPSP